MRDMSTDRKAEGKAGMDGEKGTGGPDCRGLTDPAVAECSALVQCVEILTKHQVKPLPMKTEL